jgi:integrase
VAVDKHLIPGLGAHKIDRLEPEHLERLYVKMRQGGSGPGNVHFVHRCLRAALNEAVRREKLRRNPASLARLPRHDPEEIEPFTVDEVRRILEAAQQGRNSVRWALALALGLRQSEALGLQWADVDLDGAVIRIRRSRTRPNYVHGCDGSCGRRFPGYCPKRVLCRECRHSRSSVLALIL